MSVQDPATIEDVARLASVSISTVSKVLNDYKGVSESARRRVLAAIEELGYSPNRAARSFRTGRTRTASVFLPTRGGEFYDRLITAIDGELAAHDYDAALFPLLSRQRLNRYKSADALPYQADGVILASLNPQWLFENARLPVPIPAVLVDAYHADYDTITVANSLGAEAAVKHLLERQAPSFMLQVESYDDSLFASGVFIERLKGFKSAHEEFGVRVRDDAVVALPLDSEAARVATHDLIATHGSHINIFASCDLLAKGALDACADLGLRTGRDGPRISGFDDLSWTARAGLTTVRQPIEELGRLASERLLARLVNLDAPPEHVELLPELVVRQSTGGEESLTD